MITHFPFSVDFYKLNLTQCVYIYVHIMASIHIYTCMHTHKLTLNSFQWFNDKRHSLTPLAKVDIFSIEILEFVTFEIAGKSEFLTLSMPQFSQSTQSTRLCVEHSTSYSHSTNIFCIHVYVTI